MESTKNCFLILHLLKFTKIKEINKTLENISPFLETIKLLDYKKTRAYGLNKFLNLSFIFLSSIKYIKFDDSEIKSYDDILFSNFDSKKYFCKNQKLKPNRLIFLKQTGFRLKGIVKFYANLPFEKKYDNLISYQIYYPVNIIYIDLINQSEEKKSFKKEIRKKYPSSYVLVELEWLVKRLHRFDFYLRGKLYLFDSIILALHFLNQ
ncbi:hypothetical protein BpHYR1_025707 [Brachionus plicatilis]|uniref:Uncharacterized protein n=1 Tax=Brachionus plicatilis TaxID=10195 RepID=A0A3M7RF97_BRAPC|nr:hypothetical protein BpHYR1_025707 [Brachionus plicatilis]